MFKISILGIYLGLAAVLSASEPGDYSQPRTMDYPFTVIQMDIDKNGDGKGTMSIATKIIARGNTIELENFATSPVMLTKIDAKKIGH